MRILLSALIILSLAGCAAGADGEDGSFKGGYGGLTGGISRTGGR